MNPQQLQKRSALILTSELAVIRNGEKGLILCRMHRDCWNKVFKNSKKERENLYNVIFKYYYQ